MPGENSYGMWLNEQPNGGFEWKFLDFRPKDIENYSPIYIAASLPDEKSEIASLKSRLERLESERAMMVDGIREIEDAAWSCQLLHNNSCCLIESEIGLKARDILAKIKEQK
jgi:hypothetical protein